MAWPYSTARWKALRKRVAQRDNYMCQMCGKAITGRLDVDHIIHWLDRRDPNTWRTDNLQSLHADCHSIKSAREYGGRIKGVSADGMPAARTVKRFGYKIPDGIEPSISPVTIVCGPPCSGKTTYVNGRAGDSDLVIDLDVAAARIAGAPVHSQEAEECFLPAWRFRTSALLGLSRVPFNRVWFIVSAPSRNERQAWVSATGGDAVVLDAPQHECIARLNNSPERQHKVRQTRAYIAKWFSEAR